jgi:hypothetical protein
MADESAVLDAVDIDAGLDDGQDDGTLDEGLQDDAALDDSSEIADETEDDAADEENADEEPAPEEGKEEVAADGRKMPDSIKKAIAALKPTNPEAAKEIKGLFFANQEYRNVFAKPADAVAAKTLIDEVGGHEGIQQIQSEREEWNTIDRDFSEGKKEFVTSLADGNPDAFLKTAPHVINEFAQRAPDQYQYYANNVAYNTVLREPGVEAGLAALSQLHGQLAEAPWAQQAIASVVNGIVGLKERAAQFEQKRTDPREEQLKQRETQFEQKRRADFEGGIASQAENYLKDKMQPEIDRVVGNRKVDPEAMKGYQRMVNEEVMRRLGDIPGFSDRLEAHYRTGDAKKSVEYIQSQYNRILPEAAKVISPFLRNIAPAKQSPAATTNGKGAARPAVAGEVTLREMPEWKDIDFSKCDTADVAAGHAVLKNGKKASGWI